ncbi:ribosomal protection-like ABC-F family protein [Bacillus testis]|uniref:ribosomal protection-like ABC-F family protein n=1 Tax=Bacillus testis TaxID=1622072 RepID=UPI00067F0889|nr:ABC-F type ribosomal protection protein [Bacillus testis]
MTICACQSVKKMFGGSPVFTNLSFEIQEKERIGVVGANGSGKSTILKLIAGLEKSDEGTIAIKKGTRIGYLAQIPDFPESWTCLEVLHSAFDSVNQLKLQMAELEIKLSTEASEEQMGKWLDSYGNLQARYMELGGYEIESKIEKVANGLKIKPLLQNRFSQMSGGERTKVNLAYMLLQKPDLLLLDEPTNHLDITSVEWLEQYIAYYEGTVMVVSHDRYFLDQVVTKIMDVEEGEAHIYHHSYSGFIEAKEKKLLAEFQEFQEQQKKIKKMKEAIKRLRDWANRANPPSESLHRRATNMQRALDRMTVKKKPIIESKKMNLRFEASSRSGKEVIQMKNIAKIFHDEFLFHSVDLHLQYKQRACIVGDNGSGKSTLLHICLGQTTADEGEVKMGSNVKIGYLSQHHRYENPDMTVLDTFREEVAVAEGEARHILAQFLFYGASVFKRVGGLSGGERMRLRLAQLMHSDLNLLLLDEPTNHLDIESKEVLEAALDSFEGTILAVSHDRYFLNTLFTKTFWLENETLQAYEGPYDWAKQKRNE